MFDTFKDLHRGDIVKYERAICMGEELQPGIGDVIGFGRFAFTDLVWIHTKEGRYISVPYDDVTKI